MEHRGACGGDGISGDGAGIMTQIPWKLFSEYRSENCPQPGVGMVFLPQQEDRRSTVMEVIENVCKATMSLYTYFFWFVKETSKLRIKLVYN